MAEILGVEINGAFDERTSFVEGLGPVPMQSTNPVFMCQTAKLPAGIEEGEPISIERADGTLFSGTVVTNEPDGFGMTTLNLEDDG